MDALTAAATALSNASRPMKAREIATAVLDQHLWSTSGRTPWATIEARISGDIKKLGGNSRFLRTAPGTFGINPDAPQAVSEPVPPEPNLSAPVTQGDEHPRSFTDAAEAILRAESGGRPMHYRQITERALAARLIATAGKTPEATLYAQIYQENERRTRRGLAPRFIRLGKGMIDLAKRAPGGLAFEIEKHNTEVKKQLLEAVRELTPAGFEALAGTLLTHMGFEDVEVTKVSGDNGIDARAVLVVGDAIRINMAIQAKKWKANVQSPVVQQVRGSLGAHDRGLIITTSDYSPGAREEAARPNAAPVALIGGRQLVDLMVEYRMGVNPQKHELLSLVALPESLLAAVLENPA